MTMLELRRIRVRPGEQVRGEEEVELRSLEFGGQPYLPVPDLVPAELTVTRASAGRVFELALPVRLHGPCQRCLDDAVVERELRGREYHAADPQADEELRSQYVLEERLDLSAWAHDLLAEALPDQILCREDCAGLCAVCGEDLNRNPHEHDEERPDPRWSALEALREQL